MPGPGLIYFALFLLVALLFIITVLATFYYAVSGKGKNATKTIVLVFVEVGIMVCLCYVGGENYLSSIVKSIGG